MYIDVSNKIVVITGASKGLGGEIAKRFAYEGATVVVNYYKSKLQAQQIYDSIVAYSPKSLLIKADVTKEEEVSLMFKEIIMKLGRIDILINNAGVCDDNAIQTMSYEQWQNVLSVNLTGVFLCSREFSRYIIEHRCGKIINIASLLGQEGESKQTNYSASKAGIIGFTKALAKELGPHRVSVNAICPGFISTDLNRFSKNKKKRARKKSLLPIETSRDDLISFLIFISSDCFLGVSGRVFNLDSRL